MMFDHLPNDQFAVRADVGRREIKSLQPRSGSGKSNNEKRRRGAQILTLFTLVCCEGITEMILIHSSRFFVVVDIFIRINPLVTMQIPK